MFWVLAIAACGFVAWVVPIRDRCIDPDAAATAAVPVRVPVSREQTACTLHRPSGPATLDPAACARLSCEPGLYSTLSGARLGVLALILVLYLAGSAAWAWRWRTLLTLARVNISIAAVWRITLEGQAAGILLPGGVGGDAFRISALVGKGAPTATVVASVVLDRAIGLATLVVLATVLGIGFDHATVGPAALTMAAIPVALVGGLVVLRLPALARLPILNRGWLARTAKPVLDYLGDPAAPRAILRGFAVSLLVSGAQLLVIRGEIYALGIEPSHERWVYIGTAMAFVATALPALPGSWGTAEAAFVFLLAPAGVPAPTAVAVCLLYRLFWYTSGAIGAALLMLRGGATAKETPAPETPAPKA